MQLVLVMLAAPDCLQLTTIVTWVKFSPVLLRLVHAMQVAQGIRPEVSACERYAALSCCLKPLAFPQQLALLFLQLCQDRGGCDAGRAANNGAQLAGVTCACGVRGWVGG
jgi:hypothetical protein